MTPAPTDRSARRVAFLIRQVCVFGLACTSLLLALWVASALYPTADAAASVPPQPWTVFAVLLGLASVAGHFFRAAPAEAAPTPWTPSCPTWRECSGM